MRKVLFLICSVCFASSAMAQGAIQINLKESSAPTEFSFSEVKSIKFKNEAMSVVMKAPTAQPFSLSTAQVLSIKFKPETTSIGSTTENPASAEPMYYNVQGMRVTTPIKGQLYIKREGSQTKKIIY